MSWTLVSFPHTVPPDWHTGMQASPVSSHASRIAIVTSAHPLSIGKTQSKVKVANTLDPPSTTTPPCKKEKKITDITSESTDSALANSSKWSKYEENKSLLRRHFQKRLYTVYMEQGITWRGKKMCWLPGKKTEQQDLLLIQSTEKTLICTRKFRKLHPQLERWLIGQKHILFLQKSFYVSNTHVGQLCS